MHTKMTFIFLWCCPIGKSLKQTSSYIVIDKINILFKSFFNFWKNLSQCFIAILEFVVFNTRGFVIYLTLSSSTANNTAPSGEWFLIPAGWTELPEKRVRNESKHLKNVGGWQRRGLNCSHTGKIPSLQQQVKHIDIFDIIILSNKSLMLTHIGIKFNNLVKISMSLMN